MDLGRRMNFRRPRPSSSSSRSALVPQVPTPASQEFWITQANYIGLYSLVVLGLLLTGASPADIVRSGRKRHGMARDGCATVT